MIPLYFRNKLPTSKIEENLKKLSLEITDRSVEPPHYGTLLSSSLRLHTICSCVMWLICGLSFFGFNQYISQTSPDPFTSVAAAGAIQASLLPLTVSLHQLRLFLLLLLTGLILNFWTRECNPARNYQSRYLRDYKSSVPQDPATKNISY